MSLITEIYVYLKINKNFITKKTVLFILFFISNAISKFAFILIISFRSSKVGVDLSRFKRLNLFFQKQKPKNCINQNGMRLSSS